MKSLPIKTSNIPTKPSEEQKQNGLVVRPTLGLGMLVITHLAEVPTLIPVLKPTFAMSHAQAPFLVRLGASIIFVTHFIEHSISPSGTLRAFIKLFLKWFITLALFCCVVGSVGFIAASFLENISNLLMLAAQHLFFSCLYLIGTVLLLALLGAGVIWWRESKKRKKMIDQEMIIQTDSW
jgi:hypothetical protein